MSGAARQLSDLPLGQTMFAGQTPALTDMAEAEGTFRAFPNFNSSDAYPLKTKRDATEIVAMLCRNNSGGTLAPGAVVKWESGKRGRRTDGVVTATHGEAAGVVDPYIPSGSTVPDNDLFWLIVEGDCLVNLPAGGAAAAISAGDMMVVPATDGTTDKYALTSTWANDSAALFNHIGVAAEGKSMGATGQILVHLRRRH